MTDTPDYQKLLADLMAERANLDNMIAWVEKRISQDGTVPSVASVAAVKPGEPKRYPRMLASDAFFRMSVPDAIKAYLGIMKRPANANEITEGLKQGGFTTRSKNLYATVYPTLLRMKNANEVVKVDKRRWGLTEWYPSRKPSEPSEKNSEQGKGKE